MSEITQPSWHEYMKQHGSEEYAAWDAAVKPYTERIAALTQERDSALALARQAVEVLRHWNGRLTTVGLLEQLSEGANAYISEASDNVNAFLLHPDVVKIGGGE